MKYVQASSESAGATLAQQAKYTESMQYSLEKLNNAWEALIKGMSSSEFFITVVDALTELLKVLENISPLILPIGGALAALFGAGNNVTSGFITVITALLNGNTKGFNESVLGKGLKNWIELFNAIKSKSTKIRDVAEDVKDAADGLKAVGTGADVAKKGLDGVATGANKVETGMESATTGTTALNSALMTTLAWVVVIAGITALIVHLEELMVTAAEAKENVKNLYAEIYNRQENVDNVKDLVEQYKELDKQVVKTTSDYEELASLQQQIAEATENSNLFTVSGGIDDSVYQQWLEDQKQAQIDSTREEYKNLLVKNAFSTRTLSDAYYSDDADSYSKAAALNIATIQQLTGEYTDANKAIRLYYENLEAYSLEEKQQAEDNAKQAMALEQKYQIGKEKIRTQSWKKGKTISSNHFTAIENIKKYSKKGIDWETDSEGNLTVLQDITYDIFEEKSIAEVIAEKIGNTDSTQVTEALNQWMNGTLDKDNERIVETIGNYTYDQIEAEFQEGSEAFMQYLATKSEQSAAAVAIMKSGSKDYREAMLEAKSIMDEIADTASLENINQFLDLVDIGKEGEEGKTTYEDYANGIKEAYVELANTIPNNSETIVKSLKEAGIELTDVAEVIETIMDDINDLDWSSTINGVNASISSINSINDALAEGDMSSAYKDLYALMLEYPQYADQIIDSIINEGEISSEVVESMASNAQALALAQMEADKAVAEEKANQYRIEAENLAKMIDSNTSMYQVEGEGEVDIANRAQEEVNKLIDANVESHAAECSELIKFYGKVAEAKVASDQGIALDPTIYTESVITKYEATLNKGTLSTTQKALQYAVQQAENYTNQAKAIQAMIDGVKSNKLNLFKGISKSSGSSATDEVKEYVAQLTELYNIERKIAGLDTRKNLIDSLADYYEELGDGAAQRAATKKSIELLKEQTKYYEQQIEVAEKMANTLLKSMSKQAASIVYVDKETQQLMIDYNKYSNATDEVKEEIDDLVDEYQELIEKADEGTEALLNYQLELEKYMNNIRDKTIEYQNELKDAFIKYYQDIYQAQIDALEKESELLDERKELYQDAFDEEDYNDELKELSNNRETIIKKLAKLEGASDSKSKAERTSLLEQLEEANKSYNDKVTEYNRDALLEQIDQEKDGIEERVTLLEELMDDIPNKVEMLEAAITELTNSGLDNVIRFLQQWSDEWSTALSTERQQIEEEWTSMYEYLYGDEAQNSFTTYYDNLLKKAKDTYAAIAAAASNAANSGSSSSSSSKSSGNTYTGSGGGGGDEDEPSTNVKNNWQLNQNQQYFDTEKSKTSTKGRGTVGGGAYDALTGDKIAANKNTTSSSITANLNKSTVTNPLENSYNPSSGSGSLDESQTLWSILKKKLTKNKNGGLVDFTGPTWVDGTKSNPEAFLNAHQTAMFENLTASLEKMYNNNSDIANGSPITIENVTVNTNQLNNGQDWYASGGKLAQGLQDTLRKRGIVTNINQ